MLNEKKVAQMASFFLKKAPNCTMSHLKLMKLLYLSERESLVKFGHGMCDDYLVSMDYGPVLSSTLNLIGGSPGHENVWSSYISDKADHKVSLVDRSLSFDQLDELSRADIKIMEGLWSQFKGWNQFDLAEYTHNPENCPEWVDPNGSSIPINLKTLFLSSGMGNEAAEAMIDNIHRQKKVESTFSLV